MSAVPRPELVELDELDRVIRFQRAFNVRDLGGLPTMDGRMVKRGLVYRADGVHRLDGDDLEAVAALGLRTVLDLRTEGELEHGRFPTHLHPVDWHHLPVLQRIWSDDELVPGASAADFLRERYLDMLDQGGGSLARALELIADGHPALFHCSAGKDRTGVLAAVLLGLVGVDHSVIAHDYHLSAAAMEDLSRWLATELPEAIDAMSSQPKAYLEAPIEAMQGFLTEVDARYGSVEGLVRDGLGVGEATVSALRDQLL